MENRKAKYLIFIGFILLLISILIAYRSPAQFYELSIYDSTPIGYWVGISLVIFLSLFVSLRTEKKIILTFSLILAVTAIISIVSLPLIRGYYYIGFADSITHLELAIRISEGLMNPNNLVYPAIHTLAVFISNISKIPLRLSLMFIVPLFGLLFVFFTYLVLKIIYEKSYIDPYLQISHPHPVLKIVPKKFSREMIIIGVFSALFFLPVNIIAIQYIPKPETQAVLFLPALIYLLIKHHKLQDYKLFMLILYSLFFTALVYIHPRATLIFVIFLFGVVIYDRLSTKKPIAISFIIPILSGFIYLITRGERAIVAGERHLRQLIYNPQPGEAVAQRAASASEVGGSIEEIFLKIMLVTIIFGILTIVYVYQNKRNGSSGKKYIINDNTYITHFFIALIPVSLFVVGYFISAGGRGPTFRVIGLMSAIITITGAYSFFHLIKSLQLNKKNRNQIIFIFIIFCLILSVLTLHSSPYIYRGTSHITEAHFHGSDLCFKNYNGSVPYASVRMQSDRYYAISQRVRRPNIEAPFGPSPPPNFNNQSLSTYYGNKTYLGITESERVREAELYKGFQFSYDDFEYLERDPNIHKIQSNGGFDLYLVDGS